MNPLKIYFYDTCSLLRLQERAFASPFYVSSVTFEELENIKEARNKDDEVKAQARNLVRLFEKYQEREDYTIYISNAPRDISNDERIIRDAFDVMILHRDCQVAFVTDDLLCRKLAAQAGLEVEVVSETADDSYTGWRELELTDEELTELYANAGENSLGLLRNEYAIVKRDMEVIDILKWDGKENAHLYNKPFKSKAFDTVKAKDEYQRCAMDALVKSDVVAIAGMAGCGKTLLSLAYLLQGLESQKINKLWIVGHYEPLRGSRQLGFMKGSRMEKQLTTGSLGGILSTKLGGLTNVQNYIYGDRMEIISTSDLRGVELGATNQSDSRDAVLLTEAQDVDAYTLGTLLQRCKQGTKIIIEGDMRQIDIYRPSGFRKMVELFKGNPDFAFVKLRKDYRSAFGRLAEELMR